MSRTENQNYWQQHLTAWQASKQSGAAFCREHGLSYHRFSYWRQKLLSHRPTDTDTLSGFAKVAPVARLGAAESLIVSLPSGISITGVHAGNVELLGAILRQL